MTDNLLQPQGKQRSIELKRSVRRASGFVQVGFPYICLTRLQEGL